MPAFLVGIFVPKLFLVSKTGILALCGLLYLINPVSSEKTTENATALIVWTDPVEEAELERQAFVQFGEHMRICAGNLCDAAPSVASDLLVSGLILGGKAMFYITFYPEDTYNGFLYGVVEGVYHAPKEMVEGFAGLAAGTYALFTDPQAGSAFAQGIYEATNEFIKRPLDPFEDARAIGHVVASAATQQLMLTGALKGVQVAGSYARFQWFKNNLVVPPNALIKSKFNPLSNSFIGVLEEQAPGFYRGVLHVLDERARYLGFLEGHIDYTPSVGGRPALPPVRFLLTSEDIAGNAVVRSMTQETALPTVSRTPTVVGSGGQLLLPRQTPTTIYQPATSMAQQPFLIDISFRIPYSFNPQDIARLQRLAQVHFLQQFQRVTPASLRPLALPAGASVSKPATKTEPLVIVEHEAYVERREFWEMMQQPYTAHVFPSNDGFGARMEYNNFYFQSQAHFDSRPQMHKVVEEVYHPAKAKTISFSDKKGELQATRDAYTQRRDAQFSLSYIPATWKQATMHDFVVPFWFDHTIERIYATPEQGILQHILDPIKGTKATMSYAIKELKNDHWHAVGQGTLAPTAAPQPIAVRLDVFPREKKLTQLIQVTARYPFHHFFTPLTHLAQKMVIATKKYQEATQRLTKRQKEIVDLESNVQEILSTRNNARIAELKSLEKKLVHAYTNSYTKAIDVWQWGTVVQEAEALYTGKQKLFMSVVHEQQKNYRACIHLFKQQSGSVAVGRRIQALLESLKNLDQYTVVHYTGDLIKNVSDLQLDNDELRMSCGLPIHHVIHEELLQAVREWGSLPKIPKKTALATSYALFLHTALNANAAADVLSATTLLDGLAAVRDYLKAVPAQEQQALSQVARYSPRT